jgi:hypothetical protein
MIVKIFFILIFAFFYANEIVDVSLNYKYREHINYLAENDYVPLFIDNTFQKDATLTYYQVALSLLFASEVTLDYHDESFEKVCLDYISENNIVTNNIEDIATTTVEQAINIFSSVYDDLQFVLEKDNEDFFTREDFLLLMLQVEQFNMKVRRYRVGRRRKQENYLGIAVTEYILGFSEAIDKISLGEYNLGNQDYYDIFWKFASERDKDYQIYNEDLSQETMDLLEVHLNQALLYFQEAKYWLVVDKCNMILKEDSKNIAALKLKGSSFYMLKKYDLAYKYWKRVLYYNPNDKEIEYFVKVISFYLKD